MNGLGGAPVGPVPDGLMGEGLHGPADGMPGVPAPGVNPMDGFAQAMNSWDGHSPFPVTPPVARFGFDAGGFGPPSAHDQPGFSHSPAAIGREDPGILQAPQALRDLPPDPSAQPAAVPPAMEDHIGTMMDRLENRVENHEWSALADALDKEIEAEGLAAEQDYQQDRDWALLAGEMERRVEGEGAGAESAFEEDRKCSLLASRIEAQIELDGARAETDYVKAHKWFELMGQLEKHVEAEGARAEAGFMADQKWTDLAYRLEQHIEEQGAAMEDAFLREAFKNLASGIAKAIVAHRQRNGAFNGEREVIDRGPRGSMRRSAPPPGLIGPPLHGPAHFVERSVRQSQPRMGSGAHGGGPRNPSKQGKPRLPPSVAKKLTAAMKCDGKCDECTSEMKQRCEAMVRHAAEAVIGGFHAT